MATESGSARGKIEIDVSQLKDMPNVAREAGRATAKELQQSFRLIQAEQRTQLEQARAATQVARGESGARISIARAESVAKQQEARRDTIAFNEAEKRKTAAFK